MANQVIIRLGTSPYSKTGYVNPVGEKGTPKQTKESWTAPIPTVGSPTRETHCILNSAMRYYLETKTVTLFIDIQPQTSCF